MNFLQKKASTILLYQFNFKLWRYSRGIFNSNILLDDSDDLHSDSKQQKVHGKQIALYKLYRPERITPTKTSIYLLKSPGLNKGLAFSLYERQFLGIHGLLPPAFMSEEQQTYHMLIKLRKQPNDLARYIQLDGIQDRNEKLYYRLLCEHVKELIPIVYTPTVGLACQNFGYIYRNPKGLYVTINDNSISKIHQILCNWPTTDIKAVVVSDGEKILELGDLGTYGIGLPLGKVSLYVALGGIQPRWCLPVLLDAGTNNNDLLSDIFYTGLRRHRIHGEKYDSLVDNFMKAVRKRFGQNTMIQFEGFSDRNSYRFLDYYKNKYCIFNDDIQGTASMVFAGLLAATRLTKKKLSQEKLVFLGAGKASTDIAKMCVRQMKIEGLSNDEAYSRIYMIDIDGLVTKSRKNLEEHLYPFAKDLSSTNDLLQVIKEVKPGILIGACGIKNSITQAVIKKMAEINPNPVIFALSKIINKSECTAEDAYNFTNGKCIFASGSQFPNVELNGNTFKPGQGNNAYIFSGIALGVILFQVKHIDDDLFLIAAKIVASNVTDKDLGYGRIYPQLEEIREISVKIALEIGKHCYEKGTALLYPKPEDFEHYIRAQVYSVEYDELINKTYDWPKKDKRNGFPIPPVSRNGMDD